MVFGMLKPDTPQFLETPFFATYRFVFLDVYNVDSFSLSLYYSLSTLACQSIIYKVQTRSQRYREKGNLITISLFFSVLFLMFLIYASLRKELESREF